MKNIFILKILIISFLVLLFFVFEDHVKSLKFTEDEINLFLEESSEINLEIVSSSTNLQGYTLKMSDYDIVLLNDNKIKGHREGTVEIQLIFRNKVFDTLTINVLPISPSNISFELDKLFVGIGREIDLTIDYEPYETTHKNVIITSSNDRVARIEDNKVIGVAEGKVVIIATHESGTRDTCLIVVKPVDPSKIEILGDSNILIDRTSELSIKYSPVDVSYKNVLWSSSNENIVSVENGIVKGLSYGEARISIEHNSGINAFIDVQVIPILATSIDVKKERYETLFVNGRINLEAIFEPSDTFDKSIIWESGDTEIISVSNNGQVTGVSPGTTFIKGTTTNDVSDKLYIQVKPTSKKMKVEISTWCNNYNHVGNEWRVYLGYNGSHIASNDIVDIDLYDSIYVYTKFIEVDQYSDVGDDYFVYEISENDLDNGFEIYREVYVQENYGDFAGNVAIWHVRYTFSP